MDSAILWAPYLGAFCLVALLPTVRWWLAGGAVALLISMWLGSEAARADGPGSLYLAVFVSAAWAGFATGMLARGLVLVGQWAGWKFAHPLLVLPVVLVASPIILLQLHKIADADRKARYAPPSAACTNTRHTVTLGGETLLLPISPVMRLTTSGSGQRPIFSFEANELARQFCALSEKAAPTLSSVRFDFQSGAVMTLTNRNSAFCSNRARYPWWPYACRGADRGIIPDIPIEVLIYETGAYMWESPAATRPRERYESELSTLAARDLGNGVAVHAHSHASYFTRASEPAYVARCHISGNHVPGRPLSCVATIMLTEKLAMEYQFYASELAFDSMDTDARMKSKAIFESLRP